jgi:hypothetical protein
MAAKKRTVKQESLLNTVARKLGHAAGTFTRTTQEFTETLSALPENVSARVREAANIGEPADHSRPPIRQTRKKPSRAARAPRTKVASGVSKKRKAPKGKSSRRRS